MANIGLNNLYAISMICGRLSKKKKAADFRLMKFKNSVLHVNAKILRTKTLKISLFCSLSYTILEASQNKILYTNQIKCLPVLTVELRK